MNLQPKTRWMDEEPRADEARRMSDPRGKPRVWFSCHPDDFEMAFPLISEDILRHANCCIWYDTEQKDPAKMTEEELKEFQASLEEMQLVVFGITSRFIYSENRARDYELKFAIEKHIPVLPIMLERGLAREFNKKTKTSIQVVNRESDDPTVIPYEEVLETFLKSVLIGDELAEKVRNAFDAYVFLSYRKKDREHAQRLMRIIHDNPGYRDIAIWYDEFLVPGEKYNDAIEDALRKSTLFALAVTKNLEEDGNYVMSKEYPRAHSRSENEKQFQIVSVELYDEKKNPPERIKLDRLKDHEEFPVKEIRDVHDEHIRPEVNQAFLNALERISKKENDGTPEHRFFIGLAYLCGIDMEINTERALRLIDSAARAGENEEPAEGKEPEKPCFEATEKLADMYLTGDRVPRNLEKAVEYQEMLCRQYRKEFEKHYSPDEHKGYGTKYFRALIRLSDILKEAGRLPEAVSRAEEALALAQSLTEEVGKREVERDTAVIATRLGRLCQAQGDNGKAEKYYLQAAGIYERLSHEIGTGRARRDLSIAKERLGDIARKQDKTELALSYYSEVYEIREELANNSSSVRAKRDFSVILTKLGSAIRENKGDLSQVRDCYNRAYNIDKMLAAEEKTAQARDDFGVSLVKQGDLYKEEKQYADAAASYAEARKLFKTITEERDSVSFRKHYATSCEKLASAGKHCMESEEVNVFFEEAVSAREELLEKDTSSVSAHELAVSCFNYGAFKDDEGLIRKAAELWGTLSEQDPRYEKYKTRAEKALQQLRTQN